MNFGKIYIIVDILLFIDKCIGRATPRGRVLRFPPRFPQRSVIWLKKRVWNMTIENKQKSNTCDHQDYQKKRIGANQIFGVSSYLVGLLSGMEVTHSR